MIQAINEAISNVNDVLFSDYVVYALLAVGLLFTLWSFFGQYRALTHGVKVVRGKYDDGNDPGAINHFQALSAALSATVGLGNIAGVALAVALGGPGAVLWMWLIGLLGMALKMTEVTQSMLYRNTDDRENPHGGPMFVVKKGLAEAKGLRWPAAILFALVAAALGYVGFENTGSPISLGIGGGFALAFLGAGAVGSGALGSFIGGVFVVTLITSAITGGNMFQAWSVANITNTYFSVPEGVTGIILAIVVGLVIIGGIKRIGSVAGKIVPLMCALYVLAALFVLVMNIDQVPSMLLLIVQSGLPEGVLGGKAPDATGAFLGGTFAYAAMWGVKRALFSSEAGQGSSPIAHSAAKTDEPVREGVVAGLEPFIDTIVVCTLTALVILSTGAYNREAEAQYRAASPSVELVSDVAGTLDLAPAPSSDRDVWSLADTDTPAFQPPPGDTELLDWTDDTSVFLLAETSPGGRTVAFQGTVNGNMDDATISFKDLDFSGMQEGDRPTGLVVGPTIYHGEAPSWRLDTTSLPRMTQEARRIRGSGENEAGWREGERIFVVVAADQDTNTGRDFRRIMGTVTKNVEEVDDSDMVTWTVEWTPLASSVEPRFREKEDGTPDTGLYADYAGPSLTAYAFDRVAPGLGKWLITIAAWLFAVSTMISWNYYGEQGIYFLFARLGDAATKSVVVVYKLIYCSLALVTYVLSMDLFTNEEGVRVAIIGTDAELDMWTTLGLGVMLVANIPIMLVFGAKAMGSYRDYFERMKDHDDAHEAPPIVNVAEGKDVE
ncbi:MAG: alanine:cation symporter family protein [Planctomycetota bacterium]